MDTSVKSTKEHYDTHLAAFYSWTCGDFHEQSGRFRTLMEEWHLTAGPGQKALDLGAGHGIQTYALAHAGFTVTAVDFSNSLLKELEINCSGLPVQTAEADITDYIRESHTLFDLILCWGDTLLHLPSAEEIYSFIHDCQLRLTTHGKLLLSFRNYSHALEGNARFIPVKSERERILTCMLEYEEKRIKVNDLLYAYDGEKWQQHISSYYKTRLSPEQVLALLRESGFEPTDSRTMNGQYVILATKKQNC